MKNLVLLPGWTRSERSYRGLINTCPKDYKLTVVLHEQVCPKGHTEDFLINFPKFLKENNLNKIILVGHSLGGALAMEFAYHHPEMVEKLYLVDSEGIYGHESLPRAVKNFFQTHTLHGKEKARENIRALFRTLRRPALHFKLAHFAHHADMEEEAKEIKVPTTILWGEKDHLTPLWQGEKLHELIRGSKLVILKDMDHDWILHSPELFWQNV